MSFFREIRERHLFQTLAAYAAAGWVFLEVINQFIERGFLPELAFRVGLVWYMGGLLAAMTIGWFHGEKGRQDVPRGEVAFLSVVGVAILALSGVTVSRYLEAARAGTLAAAEGVLDHRRIAVLYFDDATGVDSLAYVADALTEALIDALAAIPALDVLSENGALAFKGSGLSVDSIARAVRAGTVVTGSVGRTGDRLVVNLAVADGESGAEYQRQRIEAPVAGVMDMSRELGEEAARLLRAWLGEEVELRREREGTESVGAWALLQRAERARKQAETALEHDDLHGAWGALETADSLAAAAEAVDGRWARVDVVRAGIAKRQAQLSAADPLEAETYLDRGVAFADRALEIDRRNAEAFEHRGILRYIRWALSLEHDATAAHALLASAEEDLESAVRYDRSRADAWNVLSIIHAQKPDLQEANLAAQRAYEEDAYLRSADNVLWTLYTTSYDLENFTRATEYCAEGRRRFADDPRFVECDLWLLASRGKRDDVDRAWDLLDRYVAMAPPHNREYARARGGIIVGGVLAQAGLPDSADHVLRAHRSTPAVDPAREVLMLEAVFRIRMDQDDEALSLLKTYLTASPEHREGWEWSSHWWWRPLQDNAAYQALFGTAAH